MENKIQNVELRFSVKFVGRLVFEEFTPQGVGETIDELNRSDITDEIVSRLRHRLGNDELRIDARIKFYEGSIEWDGVLYVLNWMAVTGGTIGLVDYLQKIVMSVVNATIRRRLPSGYKGTLETSVLVTEDTVPLSPALPFVQQQISPLQRHDPQMQSALPIPEPLYRSGRLLIGVTIFNSILLGALMIVVLLMLLKLNF